MVPRYIPLPHLQPRPRGRTPPRPKGHRGPHHLRAALAPELLPAQASKTPPPPRRVFSSEVPTEHSDSARDPRIAAQQRNGFELLCACEEKSASPPCPIRPAMRENLLSLFRKCCHVAYDPVMEAGHDKHALSPRQSNISGRVWQSAPCRSPRRAVTQRVQRRRQDLH